MEEVNSQNWAWSECSGTFDWTNEKWAAEIESDKRVAKVRFKPLSHFKELEYLFESTCATGDERFNPIRDEDLDDDDTEVMKDIIDDENVNTSIDVDKDDYFSGNKSESRASYSTSNTSTKGKRAEMEEEETKSTKKNKTSGEFQEIAGMIRSHLEVVEKDSEFLRKRVEREEKESKSYSIDECIKVMDAMKIIPEVRLGRHVYSRATVKLCSGLDYRKAFLMQGTIEDKALFLQDLAN